MGKPRSSGESHHTDGRKYTAGTDRAQVQFREPATPELSRATGSLATLPARMPDLRSESLRMRADDLQLTQEKRRRDLESGEKPC